MGTSRHRKNHKKKVQQHKRVLQEKRANIKKLTDELEVAILRAQMEQPAGLLQIMEDQPQITITGS